jgi:hypothetical protein
MKYKNGDSVRIGDRVRMKDGPEGVVVFCVDCNEYSLDYPQDQWDYLGKGVMVKFNDLGLVHYESYDDELELMSRQK